MTCWVWTFSLSSDSVKGIEVYQVQAAEVWPLSSGTSLLMGEASSTHLSHCRAQGVVLWERP